MQDHDCYQDRHQDGKMKNASTQDPPIILTRKITAPSMPSDFLPRERLIALLDEYRALPVTIIQAPAGYGKSALMVSWLEKVEGHCAWVSLDKEDEALDRFWTYVLASLAHKGVIDQSLISEAKNLDDSTRALYVVDRLLATLEAYSDEVVLLLDDCHVIKADSPVQDSLSYFITHLPSNVHLVISSRVTLDLKLARLFVRDLLGVITEHDLKFTIDEIEAYYAGKQMHLSKRDVRALLQHTQGWAVALKLFSISKDNTEAVAKLRSLTKTKEAVGTYLFEEVLSQLKKKERDFLKATCCLDSFSPPLVQHIMGAQEEQVSPAIAFFVDNNLFTTCIYAKDGTVWYRYHSLFAEAALQYFIKQDLVEILEIRKKAIEWYEENSHLDEAIKTAAILNDYSAIERLILDHWCSLCIDDDYVRLMRWFEYLPAGYSESHPVLASIESLPLTLTSKTVLAKERLRDAERALENDNDALFGFVTSFKAVLACMLGDADETRRLTTLALEHLDMSEVYLRSINLQILAGSYSDLHPETSIALFENELLKNPAIVENETFRYSAYSCLCFLYSIVGNFRESEKWAEKALDTYPVQEHPLHPIFYYCYVARMNASYQKADLATTRHNLNYALEHGPDCWTPDLMAHVHGIDALLAYFDHDESRSLRAATNSVSVSPLGFARSFPSLSALSFLLDEQVIRKDDFASDPTKETPEPVFWIEAAIDYLEGNYRRVDELVEHYDSLHESWLVSRTYLLLIIALDYEALDKKDQADLWFSRFLSLSQEIGATQVCFENAELLAEPLKRQLQSGKNPYAAQLFKALSSQGYKTQSAKDSYAELTRREIEIMQLLEKGLSIKEVAQVLFISYETAKKHIAHCYQKLEVHTRVQALAAFKDLH